jgi:hypothetical protein
MEVDKIAVGGLVAGVVGAVAACIASWYAFKAPSKEDLKRVEDHTAKTSAEVSAVRGHIAQVDDHLKLQNDQQALIDLGNRASIAVKGEAWTAEPLTLNLLMKTPDLPLVRVELISGSDLYVGSCSCEYIHAGLFQATMTPETFGRWFAGGKFTDNTMTRIVSIRAFMNAKGREASRTFPVVARSFQKQAPTQVTNYNTVEGEC